MKLIILLFLAACAPRLDLSVRSLTPANLDQNIPLPAFSLHIDNQSGRALRFATASFEAIGHPRFLLLVQGRDQFFEPGIRVANRSSWTGYVAFAHFPEFGDADDAFISKAPGTLTLSFVDVDGKPFSFMFSLQVPQ